MATNVERARDCIGRCIQLRDEGRSEAVLRAEFATWLRSIFPDAEDLSWINHYTEGAEAGTRIGRRNGTTSHRFIDNLVRATVIEFEPDLRQRPRFRGGYKQVQEYVAGAVRDGTPMSQVRGILSDTVDWYIYDAKLSEGVKPEDCTPEDIILTENEVLRLSTSDRDTALMFIKFLQKHLARQQSRQLTASFIATDLGLDSSAYGRHIESLSLLVNRERRRDDSIKLATDLWSQFVDSLERQVGRFRTRAYVDEVYFAILARLLCANILEEKAMMSEDAELVQILTGEFFEDRFHLHNLIEQDYFGWLWRESHINQVLPIAREVQRDLYAYDFSQIGEEELFGRLMAQLAHRTQRKLLGQEWTPQWLAKQLAKKCIDMIPIDDPPRIIDMCCGSGSIISEAIRYIRETRSGLSFGQLCEAVTGFDIDPLAVLFAKTTWVITLADEVRGSAEPVTIPIYHADSLFAITPITHRLPLLGESEAVILELDGRRVELPHDLIRPEYHQLFDDIIDWAYDEARDAQRIGNADAVTKERAEEFVDACIERHCLDVDGDLKESIQKCVFNLSKRMADLAVVNRNGIWAFILRNTYRPSLLAGQFNGLISNPPWLAMSQFAENPYKEQLSNRALAYGIKPGGAAHLHLELATTHLLHAVDRYLKPGAVLTCLIPGTVFNGQHHAKFRGAAYLDASRPVAFELKEVWGVAPGTFKVRAAVAIGVKRRVIREVSRSNPTGAIIDESGVQECPLQVRHLGTRTAWVLGDSSSPIITGTTQVPPQGADLMPRSAVCIEIVDRRGSEWRVRTPHQGDRSYYAVKDAKKLKGKTFQGSAAPDFIHRMVQSHNLLPFTFHGNFVHIAIPARREDNNSWEIMDVAAIRTAGYTQTARRFQRINRAMEEEGVVKLLHDKINERNKLSIQLFPPNRYLVLNGAGGGVACAAFLPPTDFEDIVIDQTLYWTLVTTEQEAWYRVGLINTDALTEAIREFNPEGELGPRHLHTLPNRVIPVFNPNNTDHIEIGNLAKIISGTGRTLIAANESIYDSSRPVSARRRRLRNMLKDLPEYTALEDVAATVLSR